MRSILHHITVGDTGAIEHSLVREAMLVSLVPASTVLRYMCTSAQSNQAQDIGRAAVELVVPSCLAVQPRRE